MMSSSKGAFEDPPQDLKDLFKKYRKASLQEIASDLSIIDTETGVIEGLKKASESLPGTVFDSFLGSSSSAQTGEIRVFPSKIVPGRLSIL